MNQTIYKPYTYFLYWKSLDLSYYGCQYGRTAHPSNIWETYFTSSAPVQELVEEHGAPDKIEIRKTFNTKEECCRWEATVLRRLNAQDHPKMLNRFNGYAKWFNRGGYTCPQQHKDGVGAYQKSLSKEGKHIFQNPELRKRLDNCPIRKANAAEGVRKTLSHPDYVSPLKNVPRTKEDKELIAKQTKNAMNNPALRKHLSEKAKARCDDAFKQRTREMNKRRVSCLTCQKEFSFSGLNNHQRAKSNQLCYRAK